MSNIPRFEDIFNPYEKEDVQINYHISSLQTLFPGMIHHHNVTTGDPFTRKHPKTGKLYISHKTTDADMLSFNSNSVLFHGEDTHLGPSSYRQIDEFIHAFKQCRKMYPHYTIIEYIVQHGGQLSPEAEAELQHEHIAVYYCQRTIDKLTAEDNITFKEFLYSIFNPTIVEHAIARVDLYEEQPAYDPLYYSAFLELEYMSELELASSLALY